MTSVEAAVVEQALGIQEHCIKTAGGQFQVRSDVLHQPQRPGVRASPFTTQRVSHQLSWSLYSLEVENREVFALNRRSCSFQLDTKH